MATHATLSLYRKIYARRNCGAIARPAEGKPGDGAGQQQSAAEPKPKGKDKAAKDK